MTPSNPDSSNGGTLRKRAEQIAQQANVPLDQLSNHERNELIHELQVHQIELELQNEELRRIMDELEQSRQQFYQLFNQAPVGYLVLDSVGIIHQTNHTFCQMVNRPRDRIINHSLAEIIVEADRDTFLGRYRAFFRSPGGKNLEARLQGPNGVFYARMEGAHDNVSGNQNDLLLTVSDITERKLAEEAQRLSEERFRQLAENIKEVFWLRERSTGKTLYVSPAYETVWGRTCQELYDRPLSFMESVHPDDKARVADAQSALRETGVPFNEQYRIIRPDGQVRWVWARTFPVLGLDGQVQRYAGIAEDITEQKQLETALRESEQRYRRLAENAEDLIYRFEFLPEPHFSYVNPASTPMTGYTPEDHYADPELGYKLVYPEDRPVLESASQGKVNPNEPIVLRWQRKDDQVIWTEQRNVPVLDEQGNLIALEGIARNITPRMQTEQKLRENVHALNERIKELNCMFRLSALIEQPGITLEAILQGAIALIPPAWQYPEVTVAQVVLYGQEYRSAGFQPSDWMMSSSILLNNATAGRIEVGYLEERPASDEGPFMKEERSLLDALAERLGRVAERFEMESALHASLNENVLLLRELQHRIKNSMMMISSIVNLEASSVDDPEILRVLTGIQGRINTLSDLYTVLFASGDSRKIQLDVYFSRILSYIERSFTSPSHQFQLHRSIEPIETDTRTATSLGLILNELVTNALKYAFPDNRIGHVWVTFLSQDGLFVLQVEDDGVGLPAGFSLEAATGLGMQLVKILSDQHKGSLSFSQSGKTCFRVQIPFPPFNQGVGVRP